MQHSLLIRATVAALALIAVAVRADVYKAGESFVGFSAPDQHGTAVTFKAGDARVILFDTPAASGEPKQSPEPDWFTRNQVLPVINITDLSFIKRDIARSRMTAKSYRLLVVDNKSVAERFPIEQGKFTVLFLNEQGVITDIRFASPGKELRELLSGKRATDT
jgi:hypothetical protein